MDDSARQSLQEVKIFARENTILGIPSKQFAAAGVLTIALATQLPVVFPLAMGALMFGMLFAIYNDDPRALLAWQRAIGRPVRWAVCPRRPRAVHIVPAPEA